MSTRGPGRRSIPRAGRRTAWKGLPWALPSPRRPATQLPPRRCQGSGGAPRPKSPAAGWLRRPGAVRAYNPPTTRTQPRRWRQPRRSRWRARRAIRARWASRAAFERAGLRRAALSLGRLAISPDLNLRRRSAERPSPGGAFLVPTSQAVEPVLGAPLGEPTSQSTRIWGLLRPGELM